MRSTSSNGAFPTPSAISKSNMASDDGKLRVAAIGDLHVMEDSVAPYRELFAEISNQRTCSCCAATSPISARRSEAEILAEDIRSCSIPVLGVLGNHDYECGQPEEVCEILHEAGMTVLDEQAVEIEGVGFAGRQGLPRRLRPRRAGAVRRADRQGLRRRGAERSAQARESAAHACAPSAASPCSIIRRSSTRSKASRRRSSNISARSAWPTPIDRFDHVKAVVHGHAHHGNYEGRTPRGTPVYNVAQFVLTPLFGRPYALLEV